MGNGQAGKEVAGGPATGENDMLRLIEHCGLMFCVIGGLKNHVTERDDPKLPLRRASSFSACSEPVNGTVKLVDAESSAINQHRQCNRDGRRPSGTGQSGSVLDWRASLS